MSDAVVVVRPEDVPIREVLSRFREALRIRSDGPLTSGDRQGLRDLLVELVESTVLDLQEQDTFRPPSGMMAAARTGLRERELFKVRTPDNAVPLARRILARQPFTVAELKKLRTSYLRGEDFRDIPPDQGMGGVFWNLMGGDAGQKWTETLLARIEKQEDRESGKVFTESELESFQSEPWWDSDYRIDEGAHLPADLPDSDFGVVRTRTEDGKTVKVRKFPIDTVGRARNALARMDQSDLTQAEKRTMVNKIRRRYPEITVSERVLRRVGISEGGHEEDEGSSHLGEHDHPHDPNGVHDHPSLPEATGGHDHSQTEGSKHRHREGDPLEGWHLNLEGDNGEHAHVLAVKEENPELFVWAMKVVAAHHPRHVWLEGHVRTWLQHEGEDQPREATERDWVEHVLAMHSTGFHPFRHSAVFLGDSPLIGKWYEFEDGTRRSPTEQDFKAEDAYLQENLPAPEVERNSESSGAEGDNRLTASKETGTVIGYRRVPCDLEDLGIDEPGLAVCGARAMRLFEALTSGSTEYVLCLESLTDLLGESTPLLEGQEYSEHDLDLRYVPAGCVDPVTGFRHLGPGAWYGLDDPAAWKLQEGRTAIRAGGLRYLATFPVELESPPEIGRDQAEIIGSQVLEMIRPPPAPGQLTLFNAEAT